MPRLTIRLLAFMLCAVAQSTLAGVVAPDQITVDTTSGVAGTNVDVPVSIRDVSGSPLGLDQPVGSRIQSYSIKVDYAPAAAVQSVTFARAGITASLTPAFESSPSSAGSISLIDTFPEATNLIPFTLNAATPGNQIGVLHVMLAANAAPGILTLTLDATLTQLSNEAGTTTEKTTSANLILQNGAITINPSTPVRLQSFDVE